MPFVVTRSKIKVTKYAVVDKPMTTPSSGLLLQGDEYQQFILIEKLAFCF